MTKEEHKLYHKQKSHEHYLAHKEEYRQRQAERKAYDPNAYLREKQVSREKHRTEENVRLARKRYETQRDQLSGDSAIRVYKENSENCETNMIYENSVLTLMVGTEFFFC